MFSGALAGLLKVGAVALTAAGLSAGVYFLVQANEGEDDARRTQAPASDAQGTPEPLSPPQVVRPTRTPAAPTPTFPPADLTPPSDIDTSDWKTYESPLGFSIKYPPGWRVENRDMPSLTPGRARIVNEKSQQARAERDPDDPGAGFVSGEVVIEVIPDPYPRFVVEELVAACASVEKQSVGPDFSSTPRPVTFAGLPAVACRQAGPSPNGEHLLRVEMYWVGLPSGRSVHVGFTAADGDAKTLRLAQTILSTVSFHRAP